MKRMARLGVLLMAVAGLVASATPADALTIGGLVIQGRANVGVGLGYPVLFPPSGTIATTFTGTGVGQVDTALKAKCGTACIEVGTVIINATGSVNGNCGLSAGTFNGVIAPDLSLGTKTKARNFSITYQGVGGALVIQGSTSKGEIVVGAAVAVPDVTAGSSCLNVSAKAFIVVGIVSIVAPNIP